MSNIFTIDPNDLVNEWIQQPKRFHEAATHLAHLRAVWERQKIECDLVEAELSKEARSNPGKFGLEKATDKSVENVVCSHAKYLAARNLLVDRQEEKEVQEALVKTLEHKKAGLESMVYLRNADYYSTPKLPVAYDEKTKKLDRDNGFKKKKPRGPTIAVGMEPGDL